VKLSLMTLGDLDTDPVTGGRETPGQRHRAIVEAAAVADQVGLHGVHIGEHHGMEYIYSSPPVILSAMAERTKNIVLSTGVTLAANLDPVRVAEDYATVDSLSNGRMEMVVGRGNFFATTYDLFGQRIEDSHELFAENIELILDLWTGHEVTWTGKFRPPIERFGLQPVPDNLPPMWIGGGASESTLELGARLGLDLMLPSSFGNPSLFAPTAEKYKEMFAAAGHGREPRIGACWHLNVDKTSQRARERWEPRYRAYFELFSKILHRVNPDPPPFAKKPFDFDFLTSRGPAIVGSPEEVADRLATVSESLQADVNIVYLDMGGQPTAEFLSMVELLGTEVLPRLA
jgi:alkanesulfonate monooxygenase SsuD/methylene tetrahydromethanopterin reductase-like flavin-dependent oxidoreductase (luciferase family)